VRPVAATSQNTTVLERRTAEIGTTPPATHVASAVALSAPRSNTTRPRARLTTAGVSVIRTRPWYGCDTATGARDEITGSPGGHDAV
jgi:hypothetical protein